MRIPKPPKVPTPKPPKVSTQQRVLVISGVILPTFFAKKILSTFYKYLVDRVKKFLLFVSSWIRIGFILAIAVTIGRSMYKLRQIYQAMSINEAVLQRIVLVFADDTFEHEASRRSNVKMIHDANFEAVV